MRYPKKIRTYCPYCKKHQEHSVKQAKKKTRGSARPMSASNRQKERLKRGYGGHGKFSKPAVSKKPTQKLDLRIKCEACGKSHMKKGFRIKKFELI